MSVVVSYKKQIVFFVIALFVIVGIGEVIAKVWWELVESCAFETSEVYADLSPEIKRQMCVDSYQIQFSSEHIEPNQHSETVNINSFGFRGQEITLEKQENSFRIFTIGGSTMLGTGSTSDVTTITGFLQQYYDSISDSIHVEVINAGISGAWSLTEVNLIKNKLLQFQPNLFIVYDGWNDAAEFNSSDLDSFKNTWKDRWIEICSLGTEHNFDVIITLQPIAGTGNKEMTEKEFSSAIYNKNQGYLERLQALSTTISELKDQCFDAVDLRNSFDNEKNAIFWDNGHVGNAGNEIIAKKLFDLSLPIIKNHTSIEDNLYVISSGTEDSTSNTMKDEYVLLKRLVLENYKTPLMIKYYFFNDDIVTHEKHYFDDFQKPVIDKTPLIDGVDYSNSYLPEGNFSSKTIENSNFMGSYMRKSIFENSHLINSNFTSVNLSESVFTNSKFINVDFRLIDLSGSNLENSVFDSVKIHGADLTNSNMRFAELMEMDMRFVEISGVDFTNSNLSHSDFSGHDLRRTFFKNSDLSFANFQDIRASGESFEGSFFYSSDFSRSIIRDSQFSNMNFTNTIFENAILDDSDFTNSDLSNADFTSASLKNVNFENTNLDESIGKPFIGCINHPLCKSQ